ncbi:unnamed protein product [Discosporangium mesarthrocarpum]
MRTERATLLCLALLASLMVGFVSPQSDPQASVPIASNLELDSGDLDTAPDPFFGDLAPRTVVSPTDSAYPKSDASLKWSRWEGVLVEVYENEAWGIGRGWARRTGIPRWSYKEGSPALPPGEIRPPDEWTWVTEWKIDRSGGRDQGGWEYMNKIGKFDTSQVPRGKRFTDKFRRRRWIRAMRRKRENQGANGQGLELGTSTETTGMGAPALHFQAYDESQHFPLYPGDADYLDMDILPAKDILGSDTISAPVRQPAWRPSLGQAVAATRSWLKEEFTFRGFGIGVVKPIFKGVLLRPDVGMGVRLPLTLHFRSWEQREALPSISASLFVFWPPALQLTHALSYSTDMLQEWAAAAARKIALTSKGSRKTHGTREAVQRVGVTAGVRYSAIYGFQWWIAPYFYLLPGVRVLWQLYVMVLSFLANLTRTDRHPQSSDVQDNVASRQRDQEAAWIVAARYWAAAKTSGLGYSLNYSGNRLGAAVILNFQPFFLPRFSFASHSSPAFANDVHSIDVPAAFSSVDGGGQVTDRARQNSESTTTFRHERHLNNDV